MSWAWSRPRKSSFKSPNEAPKSGLGWPEAMSPLRLAILGAAGSGKSWLTRALSDALMAKGHSVRVSCSWSPNTTPGTRLATEEWWITEAITAPRVHDPGLTTLLMGLDLPGVGPEQQRQDSSLRQSLSQAHCPFKIVYGQGIQRLHNAMLALGLTKDHTAAWQDRALSQFNINRGRDVWQCNDCSDPACEHKLFTRLLTQRAV